MLPILNQHQHRILELLNHDPYMSQQSIASEIGLSRSTVANLITQLIDMGYIVGKAYVLADKKDDLIICVGAANMDIKLSTIEPIILETSNPAHSSSSMGGVIRNVSENLGRLQLNVSLLTLLGDDASGVSLDSQMKQWVDMSKTQKVFSHNTGTYTAVLDSNGQLVAGLADMEICELMNHQWISTYENYLKTAQTIIVDTNVQADCIDYLIELTNIFNINLVIVGVSSVKMKRLPQHPMNVYAGIFNLDESQAYFNSKEDSQSLAKNWIKQGYQNVIITQSSKPLVYANKNEVSSIPIYLTNDVVDVTGAGDSFISGLVYGLHQKKDFIEAIDYGLVNSHHTVLSPYSVRVNLNPQQLEKEMEIFKNE